MPRSYRPTREIKRGRSRRSVDLSVVYLVAIYVRISTGEGMQAEGHSIEAQIRICREFAERRGWIVVEVYIDEGFSGASDKRPAFERMLADAYAGRVQVILFHKLDRFSRSISDILKYFHELESNDILICSATEAFDFSDPADRAKFHMLAVFAQWYLDNLSEETKKGKKQRALKGLYNGRLPFGYRPSESGVAEVVQEEADLVRKAFEAYATGSKSDRDVAELMNASGLPTRTNRAWSKDSVRDFLQNEFYLGYIKYKEDLLPGQHEALISQELFDRCQEMRAKRNLAPRRYAHTFKVYTLAGLLRCHRCGETLRAQSSRQYRYYRDMSKTRGLDCEDSGTPVKAELVEEQIGLVLRQLRLPEDWQAQIQDALLSGDERQKMLNRKAALEGKLQRLGLAFADGVITEKQYTQERDVIQRELTTLVIPEDTAIMDAGLYLETLRDLWDEATLEEQKEICNTMLEAVYYDLRQQRITKLVPKAAYIALFRGIPGVVELEYGQFAVSASVGQMVAV